jgi:hypothetical protein
VGAPDEAFDFFLDRLMHAESAGRSHAKNPRSSALGPFQFINSTFIAVMRRHFPDDVARMSEREILKLRTNREVARRAAEAFSKDNMAFLVERGVTPTFGHLRLAFLLGPQGAARVLQAAPSRPVAHVLEGGVIAANPFMRRMTVADLVARATRDVSPKGSDGVQRPVVAAAEPVAPAVPEPLAAPVPPVPVQVAAAEPTVADSGQPPAIDESPAVSIRPEEVARATAPGLVAVPVPPAPVQVAAAEVAVADPGQPAAADEAPAASARPEQVARAADPEPLTPPATEPATQPVVEPKARSASDAEANPGTAARAGPPHAGRGDGRRKEHVVAVINVPCDSRLASCQRWIDQQVAKALRTSGADRDGAGRDS